MVRPAEDVRTDWSMVAADAQEALRARRAIRRFLAAQADTDSDLDGVETIVGELIANVVRHAPGAVGIHVSWDGDRATLVVADRGPGIPNARAVPSPDATSGRGLLIVQAIAPRVDIDAVAGYGSRVTVVLPVRRKRTGEPARAQAG